MGIVRCVLILCLLLGGCAAPQPTKKVATDIKTNIGTGITTMVDYVSTEENTLVIAIINNRMGLHVRCWLTTARSTDGIRNYHTHRFYSGSDKAVKKTFRLPVVEAGVTETIQVEVFGINGKLLMKSELLSHGGVENEKTFDSTGNRRTDSGL